MKTSMHIAPASLHGLQLLLNMYLLPEKQHIPSLVVESSKNENIRKI